MGRCSNHFCFGLLGGIPGSWLRDKPEEVNLEAVVMLMMEEPFGFVRMMLLGCSITWFTIRLNLARFVT